jgi:hypothetical protein
MLSPGLKVDLLLPLPSVVQTEVTVTLPPVTVKVVLLEEVWPP